MKKVKNREDVNEAEPSMRRVDALSDGKPGKEKVKD